MAEGRRRRWVLVVLALLGLGTAGWFARSPLATGAAWLGGRAADGAGLVEQWATRLQEIAATVPTAPAGEDLPPGQSRSVLIVLGDLPERCAFALLSTTVARDVAVTVFPQALMAVVPGFGEFTLAEALGIGGAESVAIGLVNLLGIRIDEVVAVPTDGLASALPPQVAVELPAAFFALEGAGAAQVMPAGSQAVAPELVERLLTDPGLGTPMEFLQRQVAAWEGVLEAVAADPGVAQELAAWGGTGEGLALALATAEAAPARSVGSLPVDEPAASSSQLVPSSAAEGFVAARLGDLLLRDGARPRVEVLNGNGGVGATRLVAERLVRHGFLVVRTDNADRFDYATTLVIAHGESALPAAREAAGLIGTGSVYLEPDPGQGVDVGIIIGLDMPAGEA